MLKYAAVFAVAGAVDTEAPVISLDLAGRVPYKLANRIEHTHATNHVGLPVGSYQDYSVRCAAGSMNHKECPSPTASAFDHHEGAIDVTTRIFMVNNNVAKSCLGGTPKNNGVVTEIDYNMRATYLFKYDATDASGNRAEQVVFALILDDLEAPNITYESTHADMPVLGDEQIIESSSEWSLTQSYVKIGALDNIDGDVSDNLKFKVEKLTKSGSNNLFVPMLNANDECTSNCYQSRNKAATVIDTTATCDTCKDSTQCDTPACVYRVTMKAKDCAGIYGHDGVDNVRTHSVTLEVRDTRKPVIHVLGKSPKTVECVSSFTGRYEEADYKGEYKNSCKADSQNDYCSEGAKIVDLLDTQVEHKNLPYTWTSTVDVGVVGDYTVEFNTKDTSGNAADPIKRTVHVIDTVKPTITNEHENVVVQDTCDTTDHSNTKTNVAKDWKWLTEESNIQCADNCAGADVTSRWSTVGQGHGSEITFGAGKTEPFHNGPGVYVQTFTCQDKEANTNEFARTFTVEDNTAPIITKVANTGGEVCCPEGVDADVCYEADKMAEYTDAGATCNDCRDGQIDHQVVITGDVVNYRVPGTYNIHFDCEDTSGNQASQVTRKVVIIDTTCPSVNVIGKASTTVEAGFPYEDLGALATDTLDGDLTTLLTQSGSLSAAHFQSMHSCAEIETATTVSGVYNLMVMIDGEHQFKPVFCDFEDNNAITMVIKKSVDQIKPYGADQGECAAIGMKMPKWSWINANSAALKAYANDIDGGNCPECVWDSDTTTLTTDYFCIPTAMDNQDNRSDLDHHNKGNKFYQDYDQDKNLQGQKRRTHQTLKNGIGTESEIALTTKGSTNGEYNICFHVKDHAGNGCDALGCTKATCGATTKDCATVSRGCRTVTVVDTLPPVITLTLKNKLIQTSDGSALGVNGEYNPAGRQGDSKHFHHSGKHHTQLLVSGNPFLDSASEDAHKSARPFLARQQKEFSGYMAEQSSTNGWIIAAAASAVAGVALMGYSMKSAAPITVPV